MGIRYVGETTAKKITESLHSMDTLQQAGCEQLMEIDEVGERIAKSIRQFFLDESNISLLEKLRAAGLRFEMGKDEKTVLSDKLAGITIVISGNFSRPREEMKRLIEQHGGKNSSAVSSATSYLLAGDKTGPAKLQKAEKSGIKIIDEKTFFELIN